MVTCEAEWLLSGGNSNFSSRPKPARQPSPKLPDARTDPVSGSASAKEPFVATGTRPSTAAHGRQLHGSLKITVVRRACRLGEQATKILG